VEEFDALKPDDHVGREITGVSELTSDLSELSDGCTGSLGAVGVINTVQWYSVSVGKLGEWNERRW
jgi:hypothetical protein